MWTPVSGAEAPEQDINEAVIAALDDTPSDSAPETSDEEQSQETQEEQEPEATKGEEQTEPPSEKPDGDWIPRQRFNSVIDQRNAVRDEMLEIQRQNEEMQERLRELEKTKTQQVARQEAQQDEISIDDIEDPIEAELQATRNEIAAIKEQMQSANVASTEKYLDSILDKAKADYPNMNEQAVLMELELKHRQGHAVTEQDLMEEAERSHAYIENIKTEHLKNYLAGKVKDSVGSVERPSGQSPSSPARDFKGLEWEDLNASVMESL